MWSNLSVWLDEQEELPQLLPSFPPPLSSFCQRGEGGGRREREAFKGLARGPDNETSILAGEGGKRKGLLSSRPQQAQTLGSGFSSSSPTTTLVFPTFFSRDILFTRLAHVEEAADAEEEDVGDDEGRNHVVRQVGESERKRGGEIHVIWE